jgi:hypothetical protein
MANTYSLISSNVLSASAASVTFSAIPSTYTDLVLRISARSADSGFYPIYTRPNGSSANGSFTQLFALKGETTVQSWRPSGLGIYAGNITGSISTANTFGSVEIYIPSYTVSQNKPISFVGAAESNISFAGTGDSNSGMLDTAAALWSNTAAITSLQLLPASSTFVSGSSFYLYGIKNS